MECVEYVEFGVCIVCNMWRLVSGMYAVLIVIKVCVGWHETV